MNNYFTGMLLIWLIRAAFLLGCFWAAYGLLRHHPRARVMLCRAVSVLLLLLPLLSLLPMPSLVKLPVHRLSEAVMNRDVSPVVVPFPNAGNDQPVTAPLPVKEVAEESAPSSLPNVSARWPQISLIEAGGVLWMLGTTFLLVRWLVALRMAQRLVRSAQEPPEWAHEFQAEIATRLHLTSRVRLGVIGQAGSPLLLGPRLAILLPRHLLEEDVESDFVPSLAHEMVHVKERDWWWSQWFHVVAAILWPLPPVWFLRRAHDDAAEIVCDSVAAPLVGGSELYAGTLARQSLHALGRPSLASIPMVRRSGIRQRIDILMSGLALPAFSRRALMATGLLALLTCGLLSGIRLASADAPTSAPSSSPVAAADSTPKSAAPAVPQPPPFIPSDPASHWPRPVSQPVAPPKIEPYGGLSWDDGLFQVIQKLKKMDGITHITWVTHAGGIPPVDLASITTPEELSAAFEKRISEYTSTYKSDVPLYDYKDAAGNDKKYVPDPVQNSNPNTLMWDNVMSMEISAEPIILASHPFKLTISFETYPGFAVQHPDRVVQLPTFDAIIPFAITNVLLSSDTNLSDDARNAIAAKLVAKYGIDSNMATGMKSGFPTTIGGETLGLIVDLNRGRIDYIHKDRFDLVRFYQNLLSKLEEDAAKKKPDGINGL